MIFILESRLQSIRPSIIEPNNSSSTEKLIQSKQERFSVMIPLTSARRTLPVIDTTFVVKLEESKNTSYQTETVPRESLPTADVEVSKNTSYQTEAAPRESLPTADVEQSKNTEPNKSYQTEVIPIESLPTADIEAPSYSQPKPPARLYFSPTLLLDDDEPDLEPIQSVLSTIDQNQSSNRKNNFFFFLIFCFSYRYRKTKSHASSIWSNIFT